MLGSPLFWKLKFCIINCGGWPQKLLGVPPQFWVVPPKMFGGPKINIFGKSKRYLEIPKFPEVPRVWNQYNSSMKLFSTTKPEKNMRLEIQLLDSGNLGELSGNLVHLSWVCTEVPKHHISESAVTFATEKQRIFTILMSDFTKTGCWPAKWVDHDDS